MKKMLNRRQQQVATWLQEMTTRANKRVLLAGLIACAMLLSIGCSYVLWRSITQRTLLPFVTPITAPLIK